MTNPQTLTDFDEPRSFYAHWPDGPLLLDTISRLRADPDCPPFLVHLAKIGRLDDRIHTVNPLGWLDDAEAGCMQAVHWHPGTVFHLYVETDDEIDLTLAVARSGGEHIGS